MSVCVFASDSVIIAPVAMNSEFYQNLERLASRVCYIWYAM